MTMVPVVILKIDSYAWPETLQGLLNVISNAQEGAPAKYQDSIRVECDQDKYSATVNLYYRRPENKEERVRRLRIEQDKKARVEKSERMEYDRLHEKFGQGKGTTR